MKLGKWISLGVLGFLGWQHQQLLQQKLAFLLNFYPMAQTYMEMASFRSLLVQYLRDHEGNPPADLRTWLNENFVIRTKEEAGVDFFGTPYQIYLSPEGELFLLSCGADQVCQTEDDLRLPL